ncbi:MAG TPA: biotin/lipoyl-binding protein [Nannocystaceae bacterium]|nr:biotin/lipoyl-binding protein [Nannocystaceae bacterium]
MLSLLRRRVLPWLVWLGAMSTAGWLWYTLNIGTSRGFVEAVAYGVAAPEIGRIAEVYVVPGQNVRRGDVIATLDDGPVVAEIAELEAQRLEVEAELGAVATETKIKLADNARSVEESVDASETARKQARADRAVAVAELGALEEQLGEVKELVDKKMADKRELVDLVVKRAALREQRDSADAVIRQLDSQATSARARRGNLPTDATEKVTEPLRAELGVIFAQQQLLRLRREAMSLRAPGDGEVTAVLLRPGELALAGAVVATVVGGSALTDDGTPIIVACTSEAESAAVELGEEVLLSASEGGRVTLRGYVERLAPQVIELPMRCWRDPRIPVFGRAVYIATDEPVALVPGQGFAIKFTGRQSDRQPKPRKPNAPRDASAPIASRAPTVGEPAPMLLPQSLRTRTRFEPSGLTWSASRQRYLVVSDDTGLPNADEQAPWLFAMDPHGRIDPEPIVLDGIGVVSDLESIAPAPDGGIYVLASQSYSKKGKRPPKRQVFAHIALDSDTARVTKSVALATLLESGDALSGLELDNLDALDIEGMTSTAAGGVLLGLKSPLDDKGRAAIWHLHDPDTLLTSGSAMPTLWGRVALTVVADGETVPAGISDLLEHGGDLLITATAALTDDPERQDGALVLVEGRAQLGNPKTLRTFPGGKPEGIALNDAGDGIVVVFDNGARPAQWMEQPWPAR